MLVGFGRAPLVVLLMLFAGGSANAHELARGVGTQSMFALYDDRIEIELNFGVSKLVAYSYMRDIDADLSDRITPDEAEQFLIAKGSALAANLKLYLNGERIPLRIERHWENGLRGATGAFVFDCYFKLVGKLPPALPEGGWWLHFHDGTFENETSTQFCWLRDKDQSEQVSFQILIPEPETVIGSGFRTIGRDLSVFFDHSDANPRFLELVLERDAIKRVQMQEFAALREKQRASGAPGAASNAAASPPAATGAPGAPIFEQREDTGERTRVSEDDKIFDWAFRYLKKISTGDFTAFELLLGIIIAILYGAGHALTPGHGKAMVSAYLVGTRGRIRDAVVLGAVVTFAHTFSVFLFGLLLIYLIQQASDKAATDTYQNVMISSMSFVSGLLLAGLGGVLGYRRWRHRDRPAEDHHHHHGVFGHTHPHLPGHGHGHGGEHEHFHEHSHGPEHEHDASAGQSQEEPKTSLRDLLVLGVSGGMIPCPAGFAIMLIAAKFQGLIAGLILFFFFSLGLGGVLIGIGVALVTGRDRLLGVKSIAKEQRQWWISRLSVASAGLILALGIYFMAESVVKDPKSFALLFHTVGRWLEG